MNFKYTIVVVFSFFALDASSQKPKSLSFSFGYDLYDIMGRKIQNFNIENSSDKSLKVDISTLPKGMYLFIFKKEESTITKKIIKR